MKLIYVFLMLAGTANAGEFRVTLKAAEEGALASDGQYRSAKFSAGAAQAAASAASSPLYPRLSLEGSLRYNHVVPEISMPAALGGGRPLGDNWNYSVGPSAYWTLDTGALRYGRDAARRTAAGRSAEAENARRQALLKARMGYFALQLALEKVYLIGENLQLAEAQLKDIELGVKAGARSRLDGIRARQETLARRRDLLRARADLSAALLDFGFATGMTVPEAEGLPLDARLGGRACAAGAGLLVRAEPYEEILGRLLPAAVAGPGKALPSVAALSETSAAALAAARAYKAEKLPRLTLGARSSLDYPNGPNLYSFVQNSASLSLNLPLFESGRLADREEESRLNARGAAERRDEAARSAAAEHAKALAAYKALLEEQTINIESVDDASEAARLAYEAYKAGGGTWLDVESANLKALQAKTTAATANAEILMRLARLDSLSD